MVFSSLPFLLLFLPATWLGFLLIRSSIHEPRTANKALVFWLLASSFVFYGAWNPNDIFIIFFVIAINYLAVTGVPTHWYRGILPLIILLNLSTLGFFKYAAWLAGEFDLPASVTAALPLGISFYVFQVIAFQVDHHRQVVGKPKFEHFALFLSFFPQLIAGPIVSGRWLIPQLSRLERQTLAIGLGLTMLSLGLIKKVLIADTLSGGVDAIYAGDHEFTAVTTLAAAVGYGTQLYFDFSGYADMAVGLALLFGIRLPQNFRAPYLKTSISSFWRSWHITLSHFLRDYLYKSLGGNRVGVVRHLLNLLITMTLGGLWHGAGFQFFLWGALHGSLLVIENTLRRIFPAFIRKIPVAISWFLTIGLVMVLWIPFRAEDIEHAGRILAGLQCWQLPLQLSLESIWKPVVQLDTSLSQPWVVLFLSILALTLTHVMPTARRWALTADSFKRGCLVGFAFLMAVKTLVARPEQPFLYFQF